MRYTTVEVGTMDSITQIVFRTTDVATLCSVKVTTSQCQSVVRAFARY